MSDSARRSTEARWKPTLSNNDNLIVDKISYRFKDPQRFDIIVFPFQYDENVYYIKRIIGLPGETVQIGTDGTIYIDGQVLEEGYGKEVMLSPGRAGEPITLGEDEYFVLGDNRNNSSDSREVERRKYPPGSDYRKSVGQNLAVS